MKCPKCENEQSEEIFCESCGASLSEANPAVNDATEAEAELETKEVVQENKAQAETNETVEKVKEVSTAYLKYFMTFLKKPSKEQANPAANFINGLISVGLINLILSFSLYSLSKIDLCIFSSGPSFGKFFFSSLLFLLIIMAITVGLIFVTSVLFGQKKLNIQEALSIYNGKLNPMILLSAVALIMALLDAKTFAYYLLSFIVLAIFLLIPLYIVKNIISKSEQSFDPFYLYISYTIAFLFVISVIASIFTDVESLQVIMSLFKFRLF